MALSEGLDRPPGLAGAWEGPSRALPRTLSLFWVLCRLEAARGPRGP